MSRAFTPFHQRHDSRRARNLIDRLEQRRLLAIDLLNDFNSTINPNVGPEQLFASGGIAYFSALTATSGRELWRTDGTAAGTFMVRDINPGKGSSTPSGFAQLGSFVYFAANDGVNGTELWRTDGTSAGTTLVRDIVPGAGSSFPQQLAATSTQLVFLAATTATGLEPWRSDGTSSGTSLIVDLYPGAQGQTPPSTTQTIGALGTTSSAVIIGRDATGTASFVTNGTAASTTVLGRSGTISGVSFSPLGVISWGSAGAVITSQVGQTFYTNGTPAGTLPFGSSGNSVSIAFVSGDYAYSVSSTSANWVTRYAWGNVNSPTSVDAPADVTQISGFGAIGSRVLFSGYSSTTGREIYSIATPTSTTASLISDAVPDATNDNVLFLGSTSTAAFYLRSPGGGLYNAFDGIAGTLWRTNGSSSSTAMGAMQLPSYSGVGAIPTRSVVLASANRLVFRNNTAAAGVELSTATTTGTTSSVIADLHTATADGNVSLVGMTATSGPVVAASFGSPLRRALHVATLPGSISSIAELTTLAVDVDYRVSTGIEVGALFYFIAYTASDGYELYVRSLTAGSPLKLTTANPGSASSISSLVRPVLMNGQLYFAARDSSGDEELWRTDGTPTGTVRVADLATGTSSSPRTLTAAGSTLYFVAADSSGTELWRSDGTAAGTSRVADIAPGSASSSPSNLTALGNALYFNATDGVSGFEPWVSDGTAAGTRMIADLAPGSSNSTPNFFVRFAGRVYFIATTAASGTEVFSTDGTAAGTSLAVDLVPGSTGSSARQLLVAQDRLFLRAIPAGGSANQLFVIDAPATPGGPLGVQQITSLGSTLAGAPIYADGRIWLIGSPDGGPFNNLYGVDASPSASPAVESHSLDVAGWSTVIDLMGKSAKGIYVGTTAEITGSEAGVLRDTYAPVAWRAGYSRDDARVSLQFTDLVSSSAASPSARLYAAGGIGPVLQSLRPVVATPADTVSFAPSLAALADGQYRLVVDVGTVVDGAGNPSVARTVDFTILRGDANGDARVNFDDLLILAANYNTTGKLFSQGDFNYDGTVNFDDLLILAARYNTSLTAFARSAGVVATPGGPDLLFAGFSPDRQPVDDTAGIRGDSSPTDGIIQPVRKDVLE